MFEKMTWHPTTKSAAEINQDWNKAPHKPQSLVESDEDNIQKEKHLPKMKPKFLFSECLKNRRRLLDTVNQCLNRKCPNQTSVQNSWWFLFSVESIELLKFWIQDIPVTVWINYTETSNFEIFCKFTLKEHG